MRPRSEPLEILNCIIVANLSANAELIYAMLRQPNHGIHEACIQAAAQAAWPA